MDTTTLPEKLWSTKRRRVIKELVKGRGIAAQLQNLLLLHKPFEDHGVVSAEELVMKIFTSFTDSLSLLNSCGQSSVGLTDQIQEIAHVGSTSSAPLSSQDSGESVKRSPVKDRRGCYKRRKTLDSWMTVSPTMEDGYAWRKYGQKEILNTKYPRCYFRCTHKLDQGCQANRQIQQIDNETKMYNITYFGHHTCRRSDIIVKAPQIISNSDSLLESCSFRSFEPRTVPSVKRESKGETLTSELSDNLLDSFWQEDAIALESSSKPPMLLSPNMIMGSDDHEDVDSSISYLCASTISYGLDMEMNLTRSVDFDNDFHFDEI